MHAMVKRDTPAVKGGPMHVYQRSVQQAQLVANAHFQEYSQTKDYIQRRAAGHEDFESGAPLFTVIDEKLYKKDSATSELYALCNALQAEDHGQAAVFSSLELVYREAEAEVGDEKNYKKICEHIYAKVRLYGFADTEILMRGNHSRYGSGSNKVTVTLGGDKTTTMLSPVAAAPGDDIVWFAPMDPTLDAYNGGKPYPFEKGAPAPGEVLRWRPVFMPVTRELLKLDADEHGTAICLTRCIGRAIRGAQPNMGLELNVGTRPCVHYHSLVTSVSNAASLKPSPAASNNALLRPSASSGAEPKYDVDLTSRVESFTLKEMAEMGLFSAAVLSYLTVVSHVPPINLLDKWIADPKTFTGMAAAIITTVENTIGDESKDVNEKRAKKIIAYVDPRLKLMDNADQDNALALGVVLGGVHTYLQRPRSNAGHSHQVLRPPPRSARAEDEDDPLVDDEDDMVY